MSHPPAEGGVPFSFFVELISALAKIRPHTTSERQPRNARYVDSLSYKTFKNWVTALRDRYSPLPSHTTAIIFRLLFPEENVQRKYGMQETRLAQYLVKILGVSSAAAGRGERLRNWKEEDALGCLGEEVKTVMSDAAHSQGSTTVVTLEQVDILLSELASKCAFSASSVHELSSAIAPRRTREAILTTLYTSLGPAECAVVTQIILKDLRPLLYPVPRSAAHYTAALLRYNSNAITMLTKEAAMHAWDPSGRLGMIYKSRAEVDEAAQRFEDLRHGGPMPQPVVGTPIQIPKCVKGQGIAQALRILQNADKVWMETKYDGERAQIHVWLEDDGTSQIKIFSKSGRESTWDRAGIHSIVRHALGLSDDELSPQQEPPFRESIVVEAEMVAFSEALGRIDEFWRIRSLIASTAVGVRRRIPSRVASMIQDALQSQCSMTSNASEGGTRHLALVFFDILLIDGVPLLSSGYAERRAALERVIKTTPGYAMLAERTCIDLTLPDADEICRQAFSKLLANYQEGAVLKAESAQYAERRLPWVKLKADYIPGYGDNIDLVLIAASWEKERARELRVPPTAYTTFYFAALANSEDIEASSQSRPHFNILFTSSYGLDRAQLEQLNFMIKTSEPINYREGAASLLPYTYKMGHGLPNPAAFLTQPLLGELFGAGFTKSQGNSYYELRFPRITKIYRPSDRSWIDGTPMSEYESIARSAVGRDRIGKAEDDWAQDVFLPGQPASPGVRSSQKRKETESLWIERLAAADKRADPSGSPSKRPRIALRTEQRRKTTDEDNVENTGTSKTSVQQRGADNESAEGQPGRLRVGLLRLASVTNLATSPMLTSTSAPTTALPRTSALETGSPPPPPSPLRKAHPFAREPDSSPEGAMILDPHFSPRRSSDTESMPLLQRDAGTSQTAMSPPELVQSANLDAIQPIVLPVEEDVKPTFTPSFRMNPQPTLHHFLKDAVVWLARPASSPRPSWRAPSHAVIPPGSQLHTLDALLLACGWGDVVPCPWVIRGVVFIDDAEEARSHKERALSELTARRQQLLQEGGGGKCKPIIVLSMKLLAYDTLEASVTAEELEAGAVCRFG